jgi:hypothetical protein
VRRLPRVRALPSANLAYSALLGTGVLPRRQPMALLANRPSFDGFGRSAV